MSRELISNFEKIDDAFSSRRPSYQHDDERSIMNEHELRRKPSNDRNGSSA